MVNNQLSSTNEVKAPLGSARSVSRLFSTTLVVSAAGLGILSWGCDPDKPCGEDSAEVKWEFRNNNCYKVQNAGGQGSGGSAGASNAGAAAGGAAGTQAMTVNKDFGEACSTDKDCGGKTSFCITAARSQGLVVEGCSQINCNAGEANAGACPAGWMCFKTGADPSACVKFK